MKNLNKIATGIALSLSMGLAATAYAQSGQMNGNMGGGHQGMQGGGHAMGNMHGAQGGHGMQHGANGGEHQGGMKHGRQDRQAAHQLMTPEERTAMQEKMRTAATPAERQQIAATQRAEMQKRAQEKGITLPEHRGPHARMGNASTASEATK